MRSLVAAALLAAPGPLAPLPLPGGEGGVGFDDLRYAPELHRLLVPAGRTGRLDLVDPATGAVESISGFSAARRSAGHGDGTTSADAGAGLVFASDRTARTVDVVDPAERRIVARARLEAGPDYVRWVGSRREVWVTEPGREAIETFRLVPGAPPRLEGTGAIRVPGGPESLVVDPVRGRAYTNTWRDETVAVDVASRRVVARWPNGCAGARGIALDAERGFLFVGCEEGKAVVLDAAHGGTLLSSARAGRGVDVIDCAPAASRLYVPGADSADLTVLAVGSRGELSPLGSVPTAPGAHCVAADDAGNAWVCDPAMGRLLVIHDPFPPGR
jgi:DNA-binding beta-propeller fold protein YncE